MKNYVISNYENFEFESETENQISQLHKKSIKFTFNSILTILNSIAKLFGHNSFSQIPEKKFEKPKEQLIKDLNKPIISIYKFDENFLDDTNSLFSEFYNLNIIQYASFIGYAKVKFNGIYRAFQLFDRIAQKLKEKNEKNVFFKDFINSQDEKTKEILKSIDLLDFVGKNEIDDNNKNNQISDEQNIPQIKENFYFANDINEKIKNNQINANDDNILILNSENNVEDNYKEEKLNQNLYNNNQSSDNIYAEFSTSNTDLNIINNINNNKNKNNDFLQKKRKNEKLNEKPIEKPIIIPCNELNYDYHLIELDKWLEINEEILEKYDN